MTKPKPPRLLELADGWAVAGTQDVHTAVQILTDEHHSFADYDRDDSLTEDDLREIRAEMGDRLHSLLQAARFDTWRTVPALRGNCFCGEGCSWHAISATPGTPGAYKVVWWD